MRLCDSISRSGQNKVTVKGKNHPHNVDNAGKDGRRVRLHQDAQEDIRKAPFRGQFAPIWHVLAVFSAKKAYQTNG